MAKIWITYAWDDNHQGDVDFIAQELAAAGAEIKLDRWNISAGIRLWPQIEKFICAKDECDAWLLVATTNSLSSEPCKEEFAYALHRALDSRGSKFAVIGLFLSTVNQDLIPAGITTRLYVSVTDPDWKERIMASAEGRALHILRNVIQPYFLKVYENQIGDRPFAIEVRPRAGVWAPFIACIPENEKEVVQPDLMIGPRDRPTIDGFLSNRKSMISKDGSVWILIAGNQSTPTESYYIWCKKLPTKIIFGVSDRGPQYEYSFGG